MSATPNVALVTIDLVTAAACFFITHQLIRSPSRAFHSLPNALFVGLVACVGTLLTCCGLFAFVGASKAILLDGSDDDPTKTSVFCRIQGKPSGASPAVHRTSGGVVCGTCMFDFFIILAAGAWDRRVSGCRWQFVAHPLPGSGR